MKANIIKTLSYAQVFDFPLTADEIHQRLINRKTSLKTLKKQLQKFKIKSLYGYYYLKNKDQAINRKNNQKYLISKIKSATKIAGLLKIFPSIQAVMMTGAVAAKNPSKKDDIDLLIITKTNTLWLTRLFVNILFDLLRIRRTPYSIQNSDKACLNLWLTTNTLSVSKSRRDLYTAHEVSLAHLLWDRNNTHDRFLSQNKWIINYLPNQNIPISSTKNLKSSIMFPLDYLAFLLQVWFMKTKKTKEKISRNYAFFHPRSTGSAIESRFDKIYQANVKKYLS